MYWSALSGKHWEMNVISSPVERIVVFLESCRYIAGIRFCGKGTGCSSLTIPSYADLQQNLPVSELEHLSSVNVKDTIEFNLHANIKVGNLLCC